MKFLPACMLETGIVFGGVCLCVRLSVRTKSRKLLIRNWCNLVEICPMVNARGGSKLVTFDFDLWSWELFSYFLNSGYILHLATSFSVCRYFFRISRLWFSFKVNGSKIKVIAAKNCCGLIGISVTRKRHIFIRSVPSVHLSAVRDRPARPRHELHLRGHPFQLPEYYTDLHKNRSLFEHIK